MSRIVALLILLMGGVIASPAFAVDRTAASCSIADINAQLTASAASGDRVIVPAGNCTWSGGITLNKNIEVIGAGVLALQGAVGGTNITRGSLGNCFTFNLTKTTRLSGINTIKCQMTSTGTPALGATFRVDHTTWYSGSSATWTQNEFSGGSDCNDPTARHPTGLVDHNIVYNYRFILIYGHKCDVSSGGNHIYKLWNQTPPMGSGTEIIYLEDNDFRGSVNCIDWADGNWGGRLTARFNSIDSPQCYFETHGTGQTGANNRGFHWLELYGNNHVNSTQFFGLAFIRGGTGFIWGNRINAGAQEYALNNNRDTASDAPLCNGSQARDQNSPGFSGWHCQDQIGTFKDNTLYTGAGDTWDQVLQPYYMWKNYIGAGTNKYEPFVHNSNALHIQKNRDYYIENSAFTGTTGVGVGTLAARPATCTTGVGYWATDQGSWNTSLTNPYGVQQNGASGLLYTCVSTNTWALLYTPFTYPHPLQAGGGEEEPPPTNAPRRRSVS